MIAPHRGLALSDGGAGTLFGATNVNEPFALNADNVPFIGSVTFVAVMPLPLASTSLASTPGAAMVSVPPGLTVYWSSTAIGAADACSVSVNDFWSEAPWLSVTLT